jgi:hypothetical protein
MRWVAFDSKDFKRLKKSDDGEERGFYSPLGVGVIIDDIDAFSEAYLKATRELCIEFGIDSPMCVYSSSLLKDELEMFRAIPFAQQLIDKTSSFVAGLHFSYAVLPSIKMPVVTVGGEKSETLEVKTEEFLRNLGPMFSYISAWNYWRHRKDEKCKLIVDAFTSKETYAWRDLVKSSDIVVVSHGDEVHPMISYADLVAFLTDVKLYNSEKENRWLTKTNLEKVWEGVFNVESTYVDRSSISKIKWINNNHIDYSRYLQKPTVFFLSDDLSQKGINSDIVNEPVKILKKNKKMMAMQPVMDAIKLAALSGYSFRFYDPYQDEKYVADGDIIVYMGEMSKKTALYLEDGFEVETIKAKNVKNKLKGLQDDYTLDV